MRPRRGNEVLRVGGAAAVSCRNPELPPAARAVARSAPFAESVRPASCRGVLTRSRMGRCPRRNALRPKPDTGSLSGLYADRRVLEPGSIPVLAVSADGRTADVRCLTARKRTENN
jgi:hypothetical protein